MNILKHFYDLMMLCSMLHFTFEFDKVQNKFGKIFGAYKRLPSSANILKDF